MPANLNALIRYRTIDKCLSNPYRKWTIGDLSEACAAALKEHRGIYSGISERTTREDIRVMRSDILGFNAPIVQTGGHYTYDDPDYSIFNVTIKDSDLLARVLEFILEIRDEIRHPEMEQLIESISRAISDIKDVKKSASKMEDFITESGIPSEPEEFGFFSQAKEMIEEDITWRGIFHLIPR
jgi:hypothetical protein